ncbi:MAG: phosphatase PAP2-related protein [Ferruginibacter sp.]
MEKQVIYPYSNVSSWSEAWESSLFRKKIIGALILFIAIVLLLPHFFAIIEARPGVVLNDWLLNILPASDFSVTIFIFVWSSSLLIIIRGIQQPAIFLRSMSLLIAITIARVITISLVPLDPPLDLINLKDPLTSLSYGGSQVFITKDLFFSGHTSNLFMFYLVLQKKRDKQFALLASITVGILVLVQHVHYSIDVIMAFVFTYCLVRFTRNMGFFNI